MRVSIGYEDGGGQADPIPEVRLFSETEMESALLQILWSSKGIVFNCKEWEKLDSSDEDDTSDDEDFVEDAEDYDPDDEDIDCERVVHYSVDGYTQLMMPIVAYLTQQKINGDKLASMLLSKFNVDGGSNAQS